jgi:hypothetical protein
VTFAEDFVRSDAGAVEPVSVVGHVQLALAEEFPLETVRGAVEQAEIVDRAKTVAQRCRITVALERCAEDPPQGTAVQPDLARITGAVDGVEEQSAVTGQKRRLDGLGHQSEEKVRILLLERRFSRRAVGNADVLARQNKPVAAVSRHRGNAVGPSDADATPPQVVVPDDFDPAPGNGKG